MIKIGGINLAPLEVEQVLLKHPDIVQAYVVGIPEIVAAAVELAGQGRQRIPRQSSPSAVSGWQATRYRRGLLFGTAAQLPRSRGAALRDEAFGQVSGEPADPLRIGEARLPPAP